MQHKALEPIGVQVTGVSLGQMSVGDVDEMRQLLAGHGVVVMPAQPIDDVTFLAFLRRFGELSYTTGEPALDGFPDLNVISNVGRTSPPRSSFHVDTSYVRHPPAYTALRAVLIPARGGETLFTNQYRAFDTLPADVKANLDGRTMKHVVTGLELDADAETEADHPIFRQHPISGRTALYVSTPQRCRSISGMNAAQARETVEFLLNHSTREENTYRHAWMAGDVVMWDNGCVLHRADHAGVIGDRVMHRGMVADYGARDNAHQSVA